MAYIKPLVAQLSVDKRKEIIDAGYNIDEKQAEKDANDAKRKELRNM